jgi:hypothetical protein
MSALKTFIEITQISDGDFLFVCAVPQLMRSPAQNSDDKTCTENGITNGVIINGHIHENGAMLTTNAEVRRVPDSVLNVHRDPACVLNDGSLRHCSDDEEDGASPCSPLLRKSSPHMRVSTPY